MSSRTPAAVVLAGFGATGAATAGAEEAPTKPANRQAAFDDRGPITGVASGGDVSAAQEASFTDTLHDGTSQATGQPHDICNGDIQFFGASFSSSSIVLWMNTVCSSNPGGAHFYPGSRGGIIK